MINEYNKTDLNQKMKDGKILLAAPKKEEVTVIGGGGKGKKGKKPKAAKAAESTGILKIDLAII